MGAIKHTKGLERKLVAVMGESKTGIYYPALHPSKDMRSVYVSSTGTAQPSPQTIEALSRMLGLTPIYEGDSITFQF